MSGLISVPIRAITPLSAESTINLLRSIFRAECRYGKLSPSVLTLSERLTVADGGIDAQIVIEQDIPSDCIFQKGLTGFQFKSGTSFKPWTESSIKDELIDSKGELFSEVERLVKLDGRYVVICTGHDLTAQQRNDSKKVIAKIFESQGYPSRENLIEVLGAGQLAEFIERHPAVAFTIVQNSVEDALLIDEWQKDVHMSNTFEPSKEQSEIIEQIRDGLLGSAKHIRVLGEPGLGKSRIVLEAVRHAEIAPIVLYFEHGSQFGQSKIFLYILKSKTEYPLVLIIDELPEHEMVELWKHLKGRCGALKLITLDHGRDETHDTEIQRLQAPKLDDATIRGIIARHVGDSNELNRWVEICEGSPRVAQAVAENLCANPDDILRSPATISLWERFLHGYERRDQQQARQVDCVTRHLALFSRFGYQDPVSEEARYIAGLIEKADPSITWARFQEIIRGLRARRVLQGSRTLFFVPRALHIHLWKQFWESYGHGFRFTEVFDSMPESLHVWFMSMFKFAGEGATSSVINDILKIDGIYADKNVLTSDKGARFLSNLAEANPVAVLRLLEATIGLWSDEELYAFENSRQNMVWTLEKIAVWKPYTVRAMKLLARLAVNENAKNSNNATGTLLGLFKIGYEWAATESSPTERLPAMLQLLRSHVDTERQLALKAMEAALDTRGMGFRTVGPEYQGLKERANLWKPKIYDEWWDASRLYFQTLIDETQGWPQHLRGEVCGALLDAVEQQILIPQCTEIAFQVLETLVYDPLMEASKLNKFFYHWLEYRDDEKHADINQRLTKISLAYSRRDLKIRFQRYVIDLDWGEWDGGFRERRGKSQSRTKPLVAGLARRISKNPHLLNDIKHLITPNKNITGALWYFGEQLAESDPQHVLLPQLIELAIASKHHICLAGYLNIVRVQAYGLYSETVSNFLATTTEAWLGARLVITLMPAVYDPKLFEQCLHALEIGNLDMAEFLQLRYGRASQALPSAQMRRLIQFLRTSSHKGTNDLLLYLLEDLPFDETSPFETALVFEAVIKVIPSDEGWDSMGGYVWKKVCNKLVNWDQTYAMPLLNVLFTEMGKEYRLSYDDDVGGLANELLKMDIVGAWSLLTKHFEVTLPKWRSDLLNWLKGGLTRFDEEEAHSPIADLSIEEIFLWIEQDIENRAALIAHATPRTLDDKGGGQLTRELLTRYPSVDGVNSGISSIFHSGGYSGPRSLYLKRRRDKFRTWLSAEFQYEVTCWIEAELEGLDQEIESAEIAEERDRFA
ncbi:MAG TPA: hypothetical protein VES38_05935 [Methylotenera sp.]|nr:hypothetical protein [Methylotenera sp.]